MENIQTLILKKDVELTITHPEVTSCKLHSIKLNKDDISITKGENGKIFWYSIIASYILAKKITTSDVIEITIKHVYPHASDEMIVDMQKGFKNIIGLFSTNEAVERKMQEKQSDKGLKTKTAGSDYPIYYAVFTASDSIKLLQGLINHYGNEDDVIEIKYSKYQKDSDDNLDSSTDEEMQSGSDISLNTIIYGPPGTGKTHSIKSMFYDKLIADNVSDNKLKILDWVKVICLAYKESDYTTLNLNEIYESKIIKDFAEEKNSQDYRATVRSTIYNHATKENQEGYFEKDNTKWGITEKGIEIAESIEIDLSTKKEDNFEMITFHQSFGYEEFIEGLKAKTNEQGQIEYFIEDGIFVKFCKKAIESAKNNENKNFLFIIDEINRGNISKVFGELITLIEDDKRLEFKDGKWVGSQVTLPYSGKKFGVPNNVYIVGTMNTADKSISMIDSALRRRFDFIELMPDSKVVANILNESGVFENVSVPKVMDLLNERISVMYDRDHTLGHALFLNINSLEDLQKVFQNKVIPLLQDYFYGDLYKVKAILNDKNSIFVKNKKLNASLFDSSLIENLYEIENQYDLVSDVSYDDFKKYIADIDNEREPK
ncbi:AAA family ATPase [Macrococcus equi]|uniref:AAA family ATPase n=1 Tax=Macrococcus equi TaxID=3395462 RepID=UPI0039BE9E4E